MRKRTERTASCFPKTQSFPQRPLDSSSILRAEVLGPAGKLKPQAGQANKRRTGGKTSSPPSLRLDTQASLGFQPLSPRRSGFPDPHPLLPPAASTALSPSPPPWGADSPGCHVSLMTSPGPLGLSQSARGSPSEVLASESEGRGAGRGGAGGCWERGGIGRATTPQVRVRQKRGAWREAESGSRRRTVVPQRPQPRSQLSFPACHAVRPPFGLCKGPLV